MESCPHFLSEKKQKDEAETTNISAKVCYTVFLQGAGTGIAAAHRKAGERTGKYEKDGVGERADGDGWSAGI